MASIAPGKTNINFVNHHIVNNKVERESLLEAY